MKSLCMIDDSDILNRFILCRMLSLIYTTLKDHQQAKRLLATTVCVHTVIDALERSVIALTWSLMSQLKHLLQGYW
jgi:hypothetical protein